MMSPALPWRASSAAHVGRLKQAALLFTVDDFIVRFAPRFPTHIKIDVDGLEAQILEGARNTLADTRLKSLTGRGR